MRCLPLAATLSLFTCAVAVQATPPPPADVLAMMERAADWQIAHPSKHATTDWTQAAYYTGAMALAEISPSPRFHDAMMTMGEGNQWKLGKRPYHADDHAVAQTYTELYFKHQDPKMLAPTIAGFDTVMAHPPKDENLDFDVKKNPGRLDHWSWCDALFMAPPAFVRLTKATGNPAYTDYMIEHWWKTSAYLYDADEHLYYRDSSYFGKKEANGRKMFWSRGNGWVIAGLARVLQYLPADHPGRARFVQQYREMAARLLELQQPDGFWHASLLDPASFPIKETSGTGFDCYGLAWGVNHGLLDRATYQPAVEKAWAAITSCLQADGKLTHVQPIGADPKKFDENGTEVYGVGAFLLAGSELYRLGGGK
jgi:rhamnogalacturonyl hydrolase YesR